MREQDISLTDFPGASPIPSMDREFRLETELFFENTNQTSLELKAEVESYSNMWVGKRMSHPTDPLGAEASWQTLLQKHLLLIPLSLHTLAIRQGFLWAVILPFISILRKHFCFLQIVTCGPCKGSKTPRKSPAFFF